MSIEELQQRTAINIQEKANLIWAIADKLVGTYKPHEYGNVTWGKNWDLIFPVEQLHKGEIKNIG